MRALTAVALVAALAIGGPTGFSSLKILPGVREAGMGGTGVASAFGPQAIAVNPAAIAGVTGFSAVAAYAKWVLDTHHQSLFVARDMGPLSLGLGVASFSAGRFEHRVKPTEEPIGVFTPTDFTGYLSVGREIGSLAQAGLTARYFYSRIYSSDASGFGADAGMKVTPAKGLVLGASVVDFGKTMSYQRDVFWLPTRARLGASYGTNIAAEDAAIRLTLAADGSYFFYPREFGAAFAAELGWNNAISLRAGYDLLSEANNLSFGLGLRAGVFRLDYSLAPMNLDLGTAHRISVGLGR